MTRIVDTIVIHCTDSPQGRGDTAATVHAWHLARGWAGIGYHYVILEDGTVERGRPLYWVGSHARGNNAHSIGICLIGRDEFTEKQIDALRAMVNRLLLTYPGAEVCGHRDLDNGKTCPNFDVRYWLRTGEVCKY
ncbi:MAG TPA: N-acetylmuramoyl-L-alanine amidase [Acidimicrobiia bacterium]